MLFLAYLVDKVYRGEKSMPNGVVPGRKFPKKDRQFLILPVLLKWI